jgi:ISXO2-like transposase domain
VDLPVHVLDGVINDGVLVVGIESAIAGMGVRIDVRAGLHDSADLFLEGDAKAIGYDATNGLENFWSLLKRGLKGTYVSIEPFHLFRYLDEQVFRFNERKGTDHGRFKALLSAIVGKRLTYKELIGNDIGAASA